MFAGRQIRDAMARIGCTNSVVASADRAGPSIHQRIAQAREARGLSQRQLAALVGVTQQAVSSWETYSIPSARLLRQVCRELGLDYEEMTDAAEIASRNRERTPNARAARDEITTLRDEVDEIKRVVAAIVRDLTKRE